MGVFSEWLEGVADRQFGKAADGRLAFFPRGWRRPGYYVEASNESKVKALVKIYFVSSALLNLVGSIAAIAFTQSLVFDERSAPLKRKLELGLTVYSVSALVMFILPCLLLWKIYKELLARVCSELVTVESDSVSQFEQTPRRHSAAVVLVLTGVLLLALGVIAAVSYRP